MAQYLPSAAYAIEGRCIHGRPPAGWPPLAAPAVHATISDYMEELRKTCLPVLARVARSLQAKAVSIFKF